MNTFPNGLWVRQTPLVPGFAGESAAALVQRTLAQHGLASPSIQMATVPHMRQGQPAQPLAPGARFESGKFGNAAGQRDYWLYTPGSAKGGMAGLIVMLHGCTQTPQDFAAGTAMNLHAERHGLGILYPAQARGANAQSCWNWFSKADQRRDRGEPAILSGMTRQIIAGSGVPPAQVFVAGLSAGAAMAVILGEAYPDQFAAVGAHSGLPFGAASDVASAFAAMAGQPAKAGLAPSSGRKPATIVFHGTGDTVVHPDNGTRIVADALSGNGTQVQTVEHGQAQGRAFSRTITSGTGSPNVEHWVVEGMGHAWSGGQAAGSYTDRAGPDASAEMVRFFLQSTPAKD
jgi:poly(hydroxyalkanoate) depolymerase family esterase